MKRKIIAILLVCMAVSSATGCGTKGGAAADTETEILTEGTEAALSGSSLDLKYNAEDYVKLGDYMNTEVTLKEADYTVTEESVNNYVDQLISYSKPYLPDETKTVVEKGDIVDVNYVGKKDGVAFDGGTAENQMIDTGANADAVQGTGFIEGFSDALIGAKVGETVDGDVTFPEDYQSEELKGQKVTFTFTVNSIGKKVERANIDDAYAKEYLQADSVEAVYETGRKTLEQELENRKQSDIRTGVIEAVTKSCSVTSFPEGLLEARLEEYMTSFQEYYCPEGTDLEEYLKNSHNMTLEQFRNERKADQETNLTQELILEAIAKKENIEFKQEEFDSYIANVVTNGGYESKEALYESLGSSAASGEAYFHRVFLANKACDMIAEQAKVTYTKEEEGTETALPTETEELTAE